jgi:ABC-2 type transport system ATP-binding protein
MTQGAGREIRFGAPPGVDMAGLAASIGATVVEEHPGEYLVGAQATPTTIAAITAWLAERNLPLADLRAGRERLEDVFLRLTRSEPQSETQSEAAP